jgi:hypothetical protein
MASSENHLFRAFQLGWTLAEVLGRVRCGARSPDKQKQRGSSGYASRLSVSTGKLEKSTEQFRVAVMRWEALALALGVISEETPTDAPISVPIEHLKQALEGKQGIQFGPPARLRRELESWSLQARSQLLAQDKLLAEAMNVGGSLADTFWAMYASPKPSKKKQTTAQRIVRVPARQSKSVSDKYREADWRELLSDYRLTVLCRRIQGLAEALPPYVASTLVHHLRRWQIGRELAYDSRGQLYHLPWYRRLRWPGRTPAWIRKRWPRRESPRLLPEDEHAIRQALDRQMQRWHGMLFGWRRPAEFLRVLDRVSIAVLRCIATSLLILGLGVGLAAVAYLWGRAAIWFIGPAIPEFLSQGDLEERLKVLSAVAGWSTTTFLILRTVASWVPQAYDWLDETLTARRVARRTLVEWNSTLAVLEKQRGEGDRT